MTTPVSDAVGRRSPAAGDAEDALSRRTYTARETARLSGSPYSTLCAVVAAGKFPVAPIRIGRRLYFPKAAVDALLAGAAPPAPPDR